MFLRSSSPGLRFVRTPGLANSGSSRAVEFSRAMPSSARTFATAPSRESVFRVPSESSSLARRQSGLMLEKICLCLTCPAMTARSTPSRWQVSMRRERSPCESVALSHAAIPRSRQLPSTSRELLNHSTFRRLDEADQQGDVFSEVAFFLQFLQGLGGVQL